MNHVEIELPGVDLDDARQRLVDDVPFLLSLLREFVRHSIALEGALQLDGTPKATDDDLRKLHQLRGGAGNLAVRTVEGVAARLELSLKAAAAQKGPDAGALKTFGDLRSKLKGELYALRDALHDASVNLVREDLVPPRSSRQSSRKVRPSSNRCRVLIVDDSSAMKSYLRATLEKCDEPLEIIEASGGLQGFQKLADEQPDLVLCDLQMPEFDGMKLLSMWASRPELKEIPVLMLTAEHEAERKVEMLKRGAADYITKPFHGQELVARVKIHLGVRRLRAEARQLRALLDQAVSSDEVTGVSTRGHFETALLEEVQRTNRYRVPLSLVFLELRPGGGVSASTNLLANVGVFLNASIRNTDKAARIDENKFALLLTHTGRLGAAEVAARLCRAIPDLSKRDPRLLGQITASIGVASSDGAPTTAEEMTERTNAALARARRAADSEFVVWTPPEVAGQHAARW